MKKLLVTTTTTARTTTARTTTTTTTKNAQSLLREAAVILRQRLSLGSTDEAFLEAKLLLRHALTTTTTTTIAHHQPLSLQHSSSLPLSPACIDTFQRSLERRCGWEPIAYIVGEKEFWSLPFVVNQHVLIPRPDSETLVQAALDHLKQVRGAREEEGEEDSIRILDLGVGSGCLLLSILHELQQNNNKVLFQKRRSLFGVGVDISLGALQVAQRNSERLSLSDSVRFLQGSWTSPLVSLRLPPPSPLQHLHTSNLAASCSSSPNRTTMTTEWFAGFDVIVSNPPYISSEEMKHLSPSIIRYEPRSALEPQEQVTGGGGGGGGDDPSGASKPKSGIEAYLGIVQSRPEVWKLLKPNGVLLLEVGWKQSQTVKTLFHQHSPLRWVRSYKDLGGIERCLQFQFHQT